MRQLLLALALFATPALAQEPPGRPSPSKADEVPPPTVSVTRHTGTFGGQTIRYTATAGETYLKADDGTPRAAIFSVAYVKEGADPRRPVTFLFNGGPGSGSVWLHMGAFGPKRVAIPSDARDDGGPPYPILDNPDSLLDVTDLVFIDPVGTGYSHALGKTDPKDYWGVTADARSVAQFIRLWLNANGRWNAPKYLGGESYGTTRSAAVLNQLEGLYNDVSLNGVILLSTVLDFAAGADTPGNELTFVLNLPSMAATALYHGKATHPGGVQAFVAEARAWATGPYAAALLKGNALGAEERATVRRDLARYTGLGETYLEQADLRVTPARFYKELLRDRGLTIGRLDSRYTGRDFDNAGETPDNDPSFYGIDGGYTAAINAYTRGDLKFATDRSYVTIGSVQPWDWRIGGGRDNDVYLNVAPYIGKALRENSGLRIFVGQGWYDFATPFFAAEYALSRTGYDKRRIQFAYYDAGHMMYVRDEDRAKLSRDLRAFIGQR
ncbi:Carboxypeptidase C (cathepsin A) [Sphingomonas guangdongensis]|uniref:Carboxypeptidase C (Cathepsin A) n=1 Tax=Sphingomonas guangdongensis TaxID=1141890 RepID=A0A285QCU0_9SPHN|nr:peptidase S10 [Sphingomonas guangdongensis]SOB79760.1 Carboxypeptidase C (cathepsin A) [Sphingomonas guangdongensis]